MSAGSSRLLAGALATAVAAAALAVQAGGDDSASARADAPERASAAAAPQTRTVATGLVIPWEMAFIDRRRALVTERPGRVRLFSTRGGLRGRPVARIDVSARGEGGLLGLAVDPRFRRNRFVYLYFTTSNGMKLVRYRYNYRHTRLRRDALVLDRIRAGVIHDSGRIAFGPDDHLYVATGDAGEPSLAQDRRSRNGKFLRLAPRKYRGRDAHVKPYTLGHRNPQGLDWQPGTGRLFATEHGEVGNDEVNLIREGHNYGWPRAEGRNHGRFTGPVVLYENGIAPSGATFVSKPGSKWTGDYLIGALKGEHVNRVNFRNGRVAGTSRLFTGRFGRIRTVVEGPGGALYLLTSNRDGRGNPRPGDDRIIRVTPPGA
jgi:glucose/arabinose dehydrogenase